MINPAEMNIEGLDELEAIIQENLVSDAPALTEIAAYLIKLGGKRIRPSLALITAKAFGMPKPTEQLLDGAAGIELIHSATLLHDDIIDKSPKRRSEVSAFLKYGLGETLLAGDFLLVRAFGLCAHLDEYIVKATTEACVELTEGEILETPLFKDAHSLEDSILIARKKTASLFRLAAECATHLAGCPPETVQHMRTFGDRLGIAFQVLDDILDVTADENVLGKAAGIDIRERKPTVVNVLWLETESALSRILITPPQDEESAIIEDSLKEILECGVAAKAAEMARGLADEARDALNSALSSHKGAVDKDAVEHLQSMISFVVERTY